MSNKSSPKSTSARPRIATTSARELGIVQGGLATGLDQGAARALNALAELKLGADPEEVIAQLIADLVDARNVALQMAEALLKR